jgi:hypothetical protein
MYYFLYNATASSPILVRFMLIIYELCLEESDNETGFVLWWQLICDKRWRYADDMERCLRTEGEYVCLRMYAFAYAYIHVHVYYNLKIITVICKYL